MCEPTLIHWPIRARPEDDVDESRLTSGARRRSLLPSNNRASGPGGAVTPPDLADQKLPGRQRQLSHPRPVAAQSAPGFCVEYTRRESCRIRSIQGELI